MVGVGGVVVPNLIERGVEEDVAVGGFGDEEVQCGVIGVDYGDGTGDGGSAVGVG